MADQREDGKQGVVRRRARVVKKALGAGLARTVGDETGAALVEYALLLVLVLLAAIAAMVFLGNTSHVPIDNVAGHLSNAA